MKLPILLFRCYIFLILGFYSTALLSQSKINETASERALLGIIESKGYNFKINEGQLTYDSILSVCRTFNTKGYRTKTEVYKEGLLSMTYEFEYESDTLLIKMRTLQGPKKKIISEYGYEYNKRNNLKKKYSLLESKKYDLITKNKYNKKGQLTRSRLKAKKQNLRDDRYKYNDNGLLSERIQLIPNKQKFEYTYNQFGQLMQIHKVFKNGTNSLIGFFEYSDMVNTKHKLHDTGSWLGVNGTVRLSHSDVLTTETTHGQGNQVILEKEYLNGKLNGYRKYFYKIKNDSK